MSEASPERTEAEKLHMAVCQVVTILNRTPEIAQLSEGLQISQILRAALADYFMDQPVKPSERKAIHRKHSHE